MTIQDDEIQNDIMGEQSTSHASKRSHQSSPESQTRSPE